MSEKITESDQKEEWNDFWSKKWMQKIMDIARNYETNIKLKTTLKNFKNIDSFCEIGCGSAILLSKIAKTAKKVTGIDYLAESLAKSKKILSDNNVKNYDLILGDIRDLQISEKFDVVYSNGLVEHFEDPGKIIYQHSIIAKKEGHVVIVVPYKYSIKNLWYLCTRPKMLRKYWPWTEQKFFTRNSLKKCCEKYFKDNEWNYEISVCHFTEDVVLVLSRK